MKKILFSIAGIVAVAALVVTSTGALFSDTETSTGNVFTAGAIDLKVDHKMASYNGQNCVENCVEGDTNLIVNGGFETPNVPNGGYAIYPDATLTNWTIESGAGLEIQDNAAGAPHGGSQLAELDSNNSSVISQTFTTVPGGKYRFKFWYSPRPNVQAPDNTIGAQVLVTSGTVTVINDTIGAGSSGGSNTSWTEHVYNFIATDSSTKIVFSDLGTANSYGGYLDDVSVRTLTCTSEYLNGGTCTLWNEKDLGQGDYFWNFRDVKPGDYGSNLISLHPDSNDAYVCLFTHGLVDAENTHLAPEVVAGDNTAGPANNGELSANLKMFAWEDDGDGIYEVAEATLVGPNVSLATGYASLSIVGGTTEYIGMAWCAGTQTVVGTTIACDGTGMSNVAQTDSSTMSVTAYAVQQRNNVGFSCADVVADYRN